MSVALNTASPAGHTQKSRYAQRKLNFMGILRSEALKFRTLTTNWVMTAVITVLMVGFALMMGFSLNSLFQMMKDSAESVPGAEGADPMMDMTTLSNYAHGMGGMGLALGNMLVGSVAVVAIGSEYATRSMQTTMTAVPRRSSLYLGKFMLLSAYSLVLGFVLAAVSYWVGHLVLKQEVLDAAPFESGVVLNWLAVAVYFMFMAWMGLGFGALLRNNAGGIMMVVLVMLVLPIIFTLLGIGEWQWVEDFTKYLPQNLGSKMIEYTVADDSMSQVEAGAWFALWAAVPAFLGYLRFSLTDSK